MDSGDKYLKLRDVSACCVPSALIFLLHRVAGCQWVVARSSGHLGFAAGICKPVSFGRLLCVI